MFTTEQADEILETIWYLPHWHQDRLRGIAWILHQVISEKTNLEIWLCISRIPEPYWDDFFVIGSATIRIPLLLLNTEAALYLVRYCGLSNRIARSRRFEEGGSKKVIENRSTWLEKPDLLDAAVRLYFDIGYLKRLEQKKFSPLQILWNRDFLPAIQ